MAADARPLVFYHANCRDGFCAAWVAHRHFGEGNAEYVPMSYGEEPFDYAGRDVYILDFSFSRDMMLQIASAAKSVTLLDHHKTAEENLHNLTRELRSFGITNTIMVIDQSKSGGRLAWGWFFPGQSVLLPPWLVRYTEDRDLWLWRLPESRELNAALSSYPRDFHVWDVLNARANAEFELIAEGRSILRHIDQVVDGICRQAIEIEMAGHKIFAVNTSVYQSEVAGKLAVGRPFGAAWSEQYDGTRTWSLRSDKDGVDVSVIANQRGGGGHKHAAGFREERL